MREPTNPSTSAPRASSRWIRAEWSRLYPNLFGPSAKAEERPRFTVLGAMSSKTRVTMKPSGVIKRRVTLTPAQGNGGQKEDRVGQGGTMTKSKKRRLRNHKRRIREDEREDEQAVVESTLERNLQNIESLDAPLLKRDRAGEAQVKRSKLEKNRRHQVPLARDDVSPEEAEEIVRRHLESSQRVEEKKREEDGEDHAAA